MERRPVAYIRKTDRKGKREGVYVSFVGPWDKMLARPVADLDVPSGKREREAMKARVRRTVGQDLTDASARFRDGVATEQDLVLLVGYRVVGEKDLLAGGVATSAGGSAGMLTVGQARDGYLRDLGLTASRRTVRDRENILKRFIEWLKGGKDRPIVEAFRPETLSDFRAWRAKEIEKHPRSLGGAVVQNKDRFVLKDLERWVLDNHPGMLLEPVVARLWKSAKEVRRDRTLPTEKQVQELLRVGREYSDEKKDLAEKERSEDPLGLYRIRWETVIRLMVETGVRRSEIVHLQWADVQVLPRDAASIKVRPKDDWMPKDYEARTIPLRSETAEELETWRKGLPEEFGGPEGYLMCIGAKTPRRLVDWPRKVWATLCERAKVKDVQPHALRHLCCVRLFKAGLEPGAIREILGHADTRTTVGIYLRYCPEDSLQRARLVLPAAEGVGKITTSADNAKNLQSNQGTATHS